MSRTEILVDGVRSPVAQAGPVDASEAVVFVHGNPGPSEDWSDLLPRAGEFARAVAPDFPGFGRAEKPKDFDYTVAGYARHLDGLLDQLGITRAHIVLHDFGGAWGLRWAADHPEKLASATLLGTGALIGYRWHHWARIWRTPILGELFMGTAIGPAFKFLIGRENPRLPRAELDARYEAFRPWPTKRAVLKLYRSTPESLFAAPAAALAPLDRPALVLWPTADRYLPAEQGERQREAFPSARVELVEGGGHWFFVEDPERVASLVIPFLRAQVAAETEALSA
jgi:pimeloyl-ACP methyl ester carboxylesterase